MQHWDDDTRAAIFGSEFISNDVKGELYLCLPRGEGLYPLVQLEDDSGEPHLPPKRAGFL